MPARTDRPETGGLLVGLFGSPADLVAVRLSERLAGEAFRHLFFGAVNDAAFVALFDSYLITTTAEGYLTRRGFVKIERDKVPDGILVNSALGDACPLFSSCMHLKV